MHVAEQPSKRAISRLSTSKVSSRSAQSSLSSTSSTSPSPLSLDPTISSTRFQTPDWSGSERLLELRLFHHYTLWNSRREYKIPIAQELWTVMIPSLAFQNPCLMDGLLACTALHLRLKCPQDGALVQASHKYMARAIRLYLETLHGDIDSQNFDALYLTALLIAFHTFTSRRFSPESAKADTIPLQCFQPFQGVQALTATRPDAANGSRMAQILPGWRIPLRACGHHRADCTFNFLLQGLDGDEVDYPIYAFAASNMCGVFTCRQPRFFFRFLGEAPTRLIELLKLQDPRTLVMVGAFFAMMKPIENQLWWFEGAADREIAEIQSALPPTWLPMLDQAKALIWGNVNLCRTPGVHIHIGLGSEEVLPLRSRLSEELQCESMRG